MTYKEAWQYAYTRGEMAHAEYAELGPTNDCIRLMADRLTDTRQQLVNQGASTVESVLFDTLTQMTFRCGWADAEEAE